MSRHIKQVHLEEKPLACLEQHCGKKFRTKEELSDHLRHSHGAPKLACKHDKCTATFKFRTSYYKHMKSPHQDHATFASEIMHKAVEEVGCSGESGEGHNGKLHKLDSNGVSTVESGLKNKQGGNDLLRPKMSAYEKIRERNIAEREEMLDDLKDDMSQFKRQFGYGSGRGDRKRGDKRKADS